MIFTAPTNLLIFVSLKICLCALRLYVFIYTHTLLNVPTSTTNKQFRNLGSFFPAATQYEYKKKIQITNKTLKKLWVSQGITINSNNKGEYQHKGIYVFCKVIDILHPLTVIQSSQRNSVFLYKDCSSNGLSSVVPDTSVAI